MKLRSQLLLALALPTALFVLMGVGAIWSVARLAHTAERILADNYGTIREARAMQAALLEMEALDAAGLGDIDVRSLATEFEKGLLACEANVTEAGETPVLARLRREWETLRDMLTDNATETPDRLPDDQVRRLSGMVMELIQVNEAGMYGHRQRTRDLARILNFALAATLTASTILLVVFALTAAKRIAGPIAQAAGNLNRILASARMRDEITVAGGGEIQRLQAEVNSLLARQDRHEQEQQTRLAMLRQRLATVMEEMRDGIVLTDREMRCQSCNRVATAILGLPEAATVNAELGPVLASERFEHAFEQFLKHREASAGELPEIGVPMNGGRRVYRPRVSVLGGEGCHGEGYLIVFWDATEHVELEEARRRFIAMLSHQLKTPLTSLTMSVNLVHERFRGRDAETDDLLRMAKEDCRAFVELVDELIRAARDVTADMRMQIRRVEMVRLLHEALKPIAGQAAEKQIQFVEKLGGRRVFASLDPVKFPWVVTNIAGNALRYTPAGGQVCIELTASDERARITIRDTGCGMDKRAVDSLFKPTTLADREGQSGPHGLGLAIAREVVDAHNGSLNVASEPGHGTTFVVEIPLIEETV
jgi:two-component system, NtrC family, sensor histidine kinase KinB